jgi:hypothetical protein
MKAVLDETVQIDRRGLYYVVAGTVLVADPVATKQALDRVLVNPNRKRAFHWIDEGPEARDRMVSCLIEVGACAHVCVHYPTARAGQVAARSRALRRVVPLLLYDGVDDLIIESRSAREDDRDRAIILDVLKDVGLSGALKYGWSGKDEPTIGLADAVCGAVGAYLVGNNARWFDALQEGGVIGELVYISP